MYLPFIIWVSWLPFVFSLPLTFYFNLHHLHTYLHTAYVYHHTTHHLLVLAFILHFVFCRRTILTHGLPVRVLYCAFPSCLCLSPSLFAIHRCCCCYARCLRLPSFCAGSCTLRLRIYLTPATYFFYNFLPFPGYYDFIFLLLPSRGMVQFGSPRHLPTYYPRCLCTAYLHILPPYLSRFG